VGFLGLLCSRRSIVHTTADEIVSREIDAQRQLSTHCGHSACRYVARDVSSLITPWHCSACGLQ
jgi:hypothetical protein